MKEYTPKPGDCFYVKYHDDNNMSYRDDVLLAMAVDEYAIVGEFLSRPNQNAKRILLSLSNWRFFPASNAIVQAIMPACNVEPVACQDPTS